MEEAGNNRKGSANMEMDAFSREFGVADELQMECR